MPDTPPRPPGFYVNFSTVSFLILVLGTIAGLWLFTWNTADNTGYQRGKAEAEQQQLKDRLAIAEENARKAALLQASKTSEIGHEQENKKTK